MQHTEDSWTRYHIYGDEQSFENSATPLNQPRFDKWITRLNLEGTVTEDLGLMFGYTNTRSKIPLKAYDRRYNADTTITERIQRRNIDNYFLKALWYATDRLTITPSVFYAPQRNKMFNDHVKDSYVDMKSGGLNLALKAVIPTVVAWVSPTPQSCCFRLWVVWCNPFSNAVRSLQALK